MMLLGLPPNALGVYGFFFKGLIKENAVMMPLTSQQCFRDELFTSAVKRGLRKPTLLKQSLSAGLFLSSFAIFHLGRHLVRGARCAEPKLAGCQVWSARLSQLLLRVQICENRSRLWEYGCWSLMRAMEGFRGLLVSHTSRFQGDLVSTVVMAVMEPLPVSSY